MKFWSWFEKTLFPILDPTKRDVSLQALHLTDNRLVIGQRRVIPGENHCTIALQVVLNLFHLALKIKVQCRVVTVPPFK